MAEMVLGPLQEKQCPCASQLTFHHQNPPALQSAPFASITPSHLADTLCTVHSSIFILKNNFLLQE